MSRGQQYIETGVVETGGYGFILRMPGGGEWWLDGRYRKLRGRLGLPTTIRGTRSGFNLIDVQKVWPAGEAEPPATNLKRLISYLFKLL